MYETWVYYINGECDVWYSETNPIIDSNPNLVRIILKGERYITIPFYNIRYFSCKKLDKSEEPVV